MTVSVPTPDDMIASFPHSVLPKIIGTPVYQTLQPMKRFMAENAALLQSSRGGGIHGYYATIVSIAIYATVSETAWIDPPFPGVHLTFPPGNLTAAQREHIIRLFDKAKREHQEFSNIQTALRKQ